MSDARYVAGGVVAIVAGLVVVLRAGAIAALVLGARTEAQRHGSLLNPDRTERTIESFNNPRARRLEAWLIRGFGVLLVIGGVIALAS